MSRRQSRDNLRRRGSAQYDDDDNQSPSRPQLTTIISQVEMPSRSRLEAAEIRSAASSRSPAPDRARSVRFSTELQREDPPRRKSSAATYDGIGKKASMAYEKKQSKRKQSPPEHDYAHEESRSPERVGYGSRTHSPNKSSSPAAFNPPSILPHSSEGAGRGRSLRQSISGIGGKSHHRQSGDYSNIDLGGVGSSSRITEAPAGDPSKKGATEVVVTSMDGADGAPLSPVTTKTPLKKGMRDSLRSLELKNYADWKNRQTARKSDYLDRIHRAYNKFEKKVLRKKEIPPTKDGRHVPLDPSRKAKLVDERTNRDYISNYIRSTRYNIYDFVPRQLFAQFRKLANFYFLLISILQMIPGLSTTGNYTTIVPLLFFVFISIGKEGYDDYRRYKLDKTENLREAKVLHAYKSTGASLQSEGDNEGSPDRAGPLHWASVKWQNLRVGDVIKLERNDPVPADLVLLHADGPNGTTYVETMALDGETNLKPKQTTASLAKRCATEEKIAVCEAEFVIEDPNADLYNFEGRVLVAGETAPLTPGEILLRGSIIRNTATTIGMVIYSGEECKIRMNANKSPRIKAPNLQFMANKVVIFIVFFVILLAIFMSSAYQLWRNRVERPAAYLRNSTVAFFPILTSFIIMFNTMIPLSLYVSLEIVKLAQMFMLNDIDMYDETTDTPFEARTSTINEELGQVSYVFSDKTGTLTDNEMKFRKLSVAGTAWLHDFDIVKDSGSPFDRSKFGKGKRTAAHPFADAVDPLQVDESPLMAPAASYGLDIEQAAHWTSSARPGKYQPDMNTKDMIHYMQARPDTAFAQHARFFLLSIALCHTALPEKDEQGKIGFQASSPDELALVTAAQDLGFLVIDRNLGTLTLQYAPDEYGAAPKVETFEILDVIEFSSKRKRMSTVVRFPDGRICILCKGADTIILKRLRLAKLAEEKVVAIEKRASRRKSLEVHTALRRKSEQIERQNSISRRSISGLPKRSINIPSRRGSVIPLDTLSPIRDELDTWLTEQEHDVDTNDRATEEQFYNPRPSTQINRQSIADPSRNNSYQWGHMDGLVDEELVEDEVAVVERCFQHINDFATEGLRTLLYSYRFLDEDEYKEWKQVYLDATTSLVDRTRLIENAGEMIERNLELAGATAIEDKLQKGVPEAIDKLRRANIRMWMLTGDKRETAINIGHSCRLIKDYSTVIVLDIELDNVEQAIADAIIEINGDSIAHCVVVVDGATLAAIEAMPPIEKLFFELTVLADSVICCRASPSQKAALVNSIRKRVKGAITLAIGDGANDIAMIQEAHVGIGITGKEGLQASRTSDYSIAQFRFLTKLLLVHGRWNYIRTCKYIVGTFWKEMLFYLTQAAFQHYNGYTGTSLYESWSLSMFNTLFTSLPVIFIGIFEKDLAASTLLAVPELYTKGQRNAGFNFKLYCGWMIVAAAEACIIFYVTLKVFGEAFFASHGDQSLFAMGQITFTACVILIWAKLQILEMHYRSLVCLISLVGCVGGWFLWNMILSVTYSNNVIYAVKGGFLLRFGRDFLWWFTLILVVSTTIVLELAVSSLRAAWFPTDVDLFQEFEKDPSCRRRFEEAAAPELRQGWLAHGRKYSYFDREAAEKEVEDVLNSRGKDWIATKESVESSASGEQGIELQERRK